MRSTKYTKILKNGTWIKISKKKNARKRKLCRSWRLNNDVSTANLENINEVLRIHKTQRAEGRGSWKLVPKDSCEIYRERRRKQIESKDRHSDDSLSEDGQRDKTRRREIDKRVKKKPVKNTKKSRRRPHSDSSVPSRTSSSIMSTSCASTSDMDY